MSPVRPVRARRLAVPLLALLSAAAAAAEPVVATPFTIRREVQEWCDEADRGDGDRGALLARAQALLAAHAGLLIAGPDGARPVSAVIAERLRARGLAGPFVDTFAAQAERRLAAARDDGDLLAVAQGHPGTAAAAAAWRRLADRAWDGGRLGAFLRCEDAAGGGDPTRTARREAARALLAGRMAEAPPEQLDRLEELWRLQREGILAAPLRPRRGEGAGEGPEAGAPLAFSRALGELTAASDGIRLRLIDHLAGREVSPALPLGNSQPPPGRLPPPVALRDGFAALGVLDQQRLVVLRCDRQGVVRWRVLGPPMGFNPALSAPLALDGLVCVASVDEQDGGSDLMVRAWSVADGHLAWESLVARLGAGRGWLGDLDAASGPDLVAAGGDLVVLSNRGLVARLAADGQVQGVWTYPSRLDATVPALPRAVSRRGALASDGLVAVATPADADGLVLVLPPEGGMRSYRGDGASGEVVAMGGGIALLAGEASLVGLDPGALRPRWSAAAPAGGSPVQAFIGGDRILVGAGAEMRLYGLADGRVLDRRRLEGRLALGLASGMVLAGSGSWIAAWGAAQALEERLAEAVRTAPEDWRPRAALASVAANRGDDERAIALYEEALARGAPADYGEQAARLVRTRLDLARPAAMPAALARLARLGAGPGELAWWRGRQAAAEGRPAEADAAFRAVAEAPDRLVAVRGRAAVSVHLLAAIARAGGAAPFPDWERAAEPAPPPAPAAAWTVEERRGAAIALGGGLVLGYADGVVSARRLADGGEAWWRRPARPLLGVQQREAAPGDGLPLSVFAGTAAAAAGLRTGDLLLRFNGIETRDFAADLVPAVLKTGVRGDFTAVVRRKDRELELRGRLGGELAEPVDADGRAVLVWPTLIQGGRPEGLWFAAHDLASGAELWRHALPPATREAGPPAPLLIGAGLVVAPEGVDLVALAVRAGAAGEPAGRTVWRLPGLGYLLARARRLAPALLWLPDPEAGTARLVDGAAGRLLAELPVDGARPPLLAGADLLVQQADRSLRCFDLSRAVLRWSAPGCSPAVAVEGDAVYCLDGADRLRILDRVNGSLRRELGELGQVMGVHRSGGAIFLHHAPEAGAHALSALVAAGGSLAWTLRLPPGVEVVATAADGDGLALVAADRDAAGEGGAVYLRLGPDGRPQRWAPLAQDPMLARPTLLAGGVLQAWRDGIAAQPGLALAPARREPVPCPPLDGSASLEGQLAGLAWRPCGEAAWSAARRGDRLVVAARGADLLVRLGNPGRAVDAWGGELRLRAAGDPVLRWRADPGPEAWRIAASGSGADGLRWVELSPPPARQQGQPLALRASAGDAADAAPGPWWLMGGWLPLQGAP